MVEAYQVLRVISASRESVRKVFACMINGRHNNPANRCTGQACNEVNTSSKTLEHVARIQESVDGKNESQTHDEHCNNGKGRSCSTQIEQVLINWRISLNFFFICKQIVVCAASWKVIFKFVKDFNTSSLENSLQLWYKKPLKPFLAGRGGWKMNLVPL